ncbi:N-terminal domain of NEFA-interacting nuclear protein NIP30-domain-containing protein [Tuber borchii]|uniref:N-terminal domain of NEFA-interacting nuclear protein NIP30-domain-containing protein n=1 Tax=Tuber borchii TaxID=42251 RepID=A0A2T6ZIP0_TUBBO|nr:N-terminal domain of NEFA-interacting nuclear protein NIP30-domain-containing protein [Tuber borchii]
MSSGFVSAGTAIPEDTSSESPRPDPWSVAQAAVEAAKKPKEEEEAQDDRSLYEILQANKAKKQEEFEEKLKFKNQFKTLDEDDVDYLDSILKTEKAVEDARKEELESRLDDFRRQQSEADKSGGGEDGDQDTAAWAAGKKRRRKEVGSKALGVKVRRKSSTTGEKPLDKDRGEGKEESLVLKPKEEEKKAGGKDNGIMGLVAYGSDEDSD